MGRKNFVDKIGDEFKKIDKKVSGEVTCKMPKDLIPAQMQLWFDDNLRKIITPRNQSDRTSFRRISNWLIRGINDKKFGTEIFETVLRYARESTGPDCRNPAAVFTAILKKELGYGK
jgi:hypothetical protein